MNRMMMTGLAVLLTSIVGVSAQADEFRGYVTALPCGPQAEITSMTQSEIEDAVADCVNNAGGKHAVFLTSSAGTFVAEPEESAANNVGYEVEIWGTLNGTTLQIDEIGTVEEMQELKQKKNRR